MLNRSFFRFVFGFVGLIVLSIFAILSVGAVDAEKAPVAVSAVGNE